MEPKFVLEFEKPIAELDKQLDILRERMQSSNVNLELEITNLKQRVAEEKAHIFSNLTPWQRVQIARHPQRPYSLDYITRIFSHFQELHGDRLFADDHSMVCGMAILDHTPVMIIAQQKGRSTKENIYRNFGMQNPEGYRKALRVMRLASRFHMPIITFVDTPGAFPGVESEERHVAEAIAVNLREMMLLETPIISIFIGEGGSGGALGIAVADRVLVLENAYYSVISPEGCAAILWKDRARAADAANSLQLSATKLVEFGIADEVIPEPMGGAHTQYDLMADTIKSALLRHLNELKVPVPTLLENRYQRFRKLGIFGE